MEEGNAAATMTTSTSGNAHLTDQGPVRRAHTAGGDRGGFDKGVEERGGGEGWAVGGEADHLLPCGL